MRIVVVGFREMKGDVMEWGLIDMEFDTGNSKDHSRISRLLSGDNSKLQFTARNIFAHPTSHSKLHCFLAMKSSTSAAP